MHDFFRAKLYVFYALPVMIGMGLTYINREAENYDSRVFLLCGFAASLAAVLATKSHLYAVADRHLDRVFANPSRAGFSNELWEVGAITGNFMRTDRMTERLNRGLAYLERCVYEGHLKGSRLSFFERQQAKVIHRFLIAEREYAMMAPSLLAYLTGELGYAG